MKIVVTVTNCMQVGVDAFRDIHESRVFDDSRSIKDIITWAEATTGRKPVGINEVQFSSYTGESL